MIRLLFKQWFGSKGERHSADDWNRLVHNIEIIASETGASIPLFFRDFAATITPPSVITEADALTMSMALGMESCISALSSFMGITYPSYNFHDGDFVSFVDVNRWEQGIFACYRKAGGAGRPEDTDMVETVLFPFSDWIESPDGTFSQTAASIIAESDMKGIVGLSQYQNDQAAQWAILGPYVESVDDGSVTVRCSGMLAGGKDLELTLFKIGDDAMQYEVNVGTTGWTSGGDGSVNITVPVPGLPAAAEGVIGYATGDLAGAMAGVAAGIVMTGQAAGQITLRAGSVPHQAVKLVITAVV